MKQKSNRSGVENWHNTRTLHLCRRFASFQLHWQNWNSRPFDWLVREYEQLAILTINELSKRSYRRKKTCKRKNVNRTRTSKRKKGLNIKLCAVNWNGKMNIWGSFECYMLRVNVRNLPLSVYKKKRRIKKQQMTTRRTVFTFECFGLIGLRHDNLFSLGSIFGIATFCFTWQPK